MSRSILFVSSVFLPRISRDCFPSKRSFTTGFSNSHASSRSSRNAIEIINWIRYYAPVFKVQSDAIEVLHEPAEFFETLKDNIKSAKHRIVLASLYLGTGHLEKQLVDCIHSTVKKSLASGTSKLDVEILLEHTRGSRGTVNSRTMLLPLIQEFGDSVHVSLYHTPELRGLRKMMLPERFNETVALTHLKVYLTDDTIIMSGANLSHDYFTNRQDRYIEIRNSPKVADFFHKLITTVRELSLQLQSDNTTKMASTFPYHPIQDCDGGANFRTEAAKRLLKMMNGYSQTSEKDITLRSGKCTWVVPLLQMFPYGIRQDELVTSELLASLPSESKLLLASGYFNLTRKYIGLVLNLAARCDILTAHPSVNGFYKAKGVAGGIPHAYTQITKDFYKQVVNHGHCDHITLWEYSRDNWTFHVKGLWYYPPHHPCPCLTLVGSPNFGYRSVYRDLEAQVAIVTEDEGLQQHLHVEQERFYGCADKVTGRTFELSQRRVPIWVFVVTKFIKKFL